MTRSDLAGLSSAMDVRTVEFRRYKHDSWGWYVWLVSADGREVHLGDAWEGWPMVALVATCEQLGLFYRLRERLCGSAHVPAEMRYECDHCHPELSGETYFPRNPNGGVYAFYSY